MKIIATKKNKQLIIFYRVQITVKGKEYFLHFESKDGKFPDYTKVSTAQGQYFTFSEKTRKKHYQKILNSL